MITAFVPARQGSERLQNKNMRQLAGMSLASLSVLQALELHGVSNVVFSTDSERYAESAIGDVQNAGSSTNRLTIHYRDASAAGPHAKIFDVLRSLASNSFFETEFVLLMLPTAPLRHRSTAERIINLTKNQGQAAFTACPYDFHVPFAFRLTSEDTDKPWDPLLVSSPMVTGVTRSQDQSIYLHPHGGFATARVSELQDRRTIYEGARPVVTTRIEGLDVDVSEDLRLVRCLEDGLREAFPFMTEQK